MKRWSILTFFFLFLAAPYAVDGEEFELSPVVLTGDPAPEGGVFTQVSVFSMNNLGTIAFQGRGQGSVYSVQDKTITRLIKPGDSIFDCSRTTPIGTLSGTPTFVSQPLFLNDSQEIVFKGLLGGKEFPFIFSGGILSHPVGCVTSLLREISGDDFATVTTSLPALLSNTGTIALDFITFENGGFKHRFFLVNGGIATHLPLVGTLAPDGRTITGGNVAAINDVGDLLIRFIVSGASGRFLQSGGSRVLIAVSGGPALEGKTFKSIAQSAMNNNGEVVFVAQLSDLRRSVFHRAPDGTLTQIAKEFDPIPGGGSFFFFREVDINEKGDIAFSDNNGIYFFSADGELSKVVRQFDPTPAGGIFTASPGALFKLNNNGDIAFRALISTGQTGIFLAFPEALEVEFVDPVPDLLKELTQTPEEAKVRLSQKAETVEGVAADGVTRVVVRVTVPAQSTVELALVDEAGMPIADPDEAGSLTQLRGAIGSNRISVSTVDVPGIGPMAFAIYHAPSRFSPSASPDTNVVERQVRLRASIPQTGNATQGTTAFIRIVRPPLVLIHGLWSNPSEAWDGFRANLQQALPGVNIVAPTYEDTNASDFSVNVTVPLEAINEAKDQMRSKNIAVVQADVFGHSMGGLLSRIWAGGPSYRRGENYNEGDINKLVTIDSPHFGSFLADLTIAFLATLNPTNRLALLETARVLGFALGDGAIENLATFSLEIATIRATTTDVPSHAIVGDFIVDVDLALAPDPLGRFFRMLKIAGFDTSVDVIPGSSDLVVTTTSQAGGLAPPAASTFNHVHIGATSNPDVADEAVDISNASLDDPISIFSPGFPTD